MSGTNWWATLIELLVAVGFFESIRQLARRIFNRRRDARRASLDDAQVIQGMSLKLLGPLERQLAQAQASVEAANKRADRVLDRMREIEEDFDALVTWAREAKALMEARGIPTPPIPLRTNRPRPNAAR